MADPMKLTPKQARFVQEYLIDLNAAQAAIRAGYSAKTARMIGHENLTKPEIAAAIEKAMAERAERTGLTADWVVDELRKIAGGGLGDHIMRSTPEGATYFDFSVMTPAQVSALGVKRAALVDLGRHLGMFVTKHHHDGNIEVVTNAREFIISRIERLAASKRVRDSQRSEDEP
jgi:phage terminase small subunit